MPEGAEVRCIACGEPLSFHPDSYPLAFRCERGHLQTINSLLDMVVPKDQAASGSALDYLRKKAEVVHHLAARALAQGHVFVAADYLETAGRMDRWAVCLEKLLSHRKSSPRTADH